MSSKTWQGLITNRHLGLDLLKLLSIMRIQIQTREGVARPTLVTGCFDDCRTSSLTEISQHKHVATFIRIHTPEFKVREIAISAEAILDITRIPRRVLRPRASATSRYGLGDTDVSSSLRSECSIFEDCYVPLFPSSRLWFIIRTTAYRLKAKYIIILITRSQR
jgi:hypothetical protein